MFESLRHILRFLAVARALARHDALFWIDDVGRAPAGLKLIVRLATRFVRRRKGLAERRGKRLAAALQDLGPAYIKLGQMLATRPDLIGHDVALDLRQLQDRLPPFPADRVRAIIEAELGRPLEECFAEFSPEPVAAASIAQVHKARTPEGMAVAVKVLRPGIEAAFERDLAAFSWFARFAERTVPKARRLRLVAVVETVVQTVASELDLRLEAAAASELAENMAGEPGYRIPLIDWERTTGHMMTLEWIDGIPLSDVDRLDAAGLDRRALASTIVRAFLLQAMRDGFFHGDMHQGNLFVDAEGNVVALDFGIMGRLDRESRRYLAEILYGFLQKDYRRVARWHFSAGYVPADQSEETFAQAMRAVAEPIFGRPVRSVSAGRLLGQLFATTEAFGMETQPQLLLLQRSMVMVEGMALHLDHEANMWALSRPVIGDWMRDQLSPEVALADHVNTVIESLGLLPKLVRRASDLMEDLETKVRDEKDRPNPERMGLEGWPGIALLAAGAVILGWIVGRL
ncbi:MULTISPECIES: 2-polyprenylphenol 6-hydroxylase [unclassified Iodidimonas]|uniref:2-polyprenylphenol 6-hydroxylase n=1 Tax=unclassified Iodidimonas TaxID=2626145 RepID=UPI00248257CF|nr:MULTISPECIES: 2-polyprenylphenol 6-hydroxylase [unclassified Iodidimonas]